MTNERHEKALEAAVQAFYGGDFELAGSPGNRRDVSDAITAYLQAMDAVIVPRSVAFDETLNDLGWDMNKFLSKGGAVFGASIFNNMKTFLKTAIEKWVSKAPNHFTNGE